MKKLPPLESCPSRSVVYGLPAKGKNIWEGYGENPPVKKIYTQYGKYGLDLKIVRYMLVGTFPGFFWTFRKKLKAKITQAEKKIRANFEENTSKNHSKTQVFAN